MPSPSVPRPSAPRRLPLQVGLITGRDRDAASTMPSSTCAPSISPKQLPVQRSDVTGCERGASSATPSSPFAPSASPEAASGSGLSHRRMTSPTNPTAQMKSPAMVLL